jgi:hypothetical protein
MVGVVAVCLLEKLMGRFYYIGIFARAVYLRGLEFSRRHLLKRVSGVKRRLFGYGDKIGSGPVEVLPAEDGRRRRPPAGPALRM